MKTSYVMITKRCIQSRTLQAESALARFKENLRMQVFFLACGLAPETKNLRTQVFCLTTKHERGRQCRPLCC